MRHANIEGGTLTAVYDDRWVPLLAVLGKLRMTRATRVEWSDEAQVWVATRLDNGQEIARGTNRAQCIEEEVRVLDAELEVAR